MQASPQILEESEHGDSDSEIGEVEEGIESEGDIDRDNVVKF